MRMETARPRRTRESAVPQRIVSVVIQLRVARSLVNVFSGRWVEIFLRMNVANTTFPARVATVHFTFERFHVFVESRYIIASLKRCSDVSDSNFSLPSAVVESLHTSILVWKALPDGSTRPGHTYTDVHTLVKLVISGTSVVTYNVPARAQPLHPAHPVSPQQTQLLRHT